MNLPFMAHRDVRGLRSRVRGFPVAGFLKDLTLRYGRARTGINPEILSFRVSLA
jgi:hypothetical protein